MSKAKSEFYDFSEVTDEMRRNHIKTHFDWPHAKKMQVLSSKVKSHQEFLDEMKRYAVRMATLTLVGHWFTVVITLGIVLLFQDRKQYLNLKDITESKVKRFHYPFRFFRKYFEPGPAIITDAWLDEQRKKSKEEHENFMENSRRQQEQRRIESAREREESHRTFLDYRRRIREATDELRRALPVETEPEVSLNN